MKKINLKKPSLNFLIIGSFVIVMAIFTILVQLIGYFAFSRSFEKEYSDSVGRVAKLSTMALANYDVTRFLKYSQEELNEMNEKYPSYSEYKEYCAENGLEENYSYYIDYTEYEVGKESLDIICNTMGASVIYVILPSDDYMSYTCIYNCVSDESGYDPWPIGKVVETPKEYYGVYEKIMEEGSEQEIVERYTNLKEGKPHITALTPVCDEQGNVVAILCVQRFAEGLTKTRRNFIQGVSAIAFIIAILIILLESRLIRRAIVKPIQDISAEAGRFAKDSTKANSDLIENNYSVREIGSLAYALDKMEADTVDNIENMKEMISEKERIGADLSLASKIQIGMLPLKNQLLKDHTEFDVHAIMTPAKTVGGDFYDFYMVDDDHMAIEIADVSDKGLGAAFFMAISKTLIKSRAGMGGSATDIITYVDRLIAEKNAAGMFVTVWLAIIDLNTGHVDVCNAGHDYPAISLKGQDFVVEKAPHGPPVAFLPGVPFTGYEFTLEPGDRIFLYTDGLNEAKRSDGERFGIARMLTVLNSHKNDTNEQMIAAMKEAVTLFVGSEPQFDDQTMLSFTFNGRKNK